MITIQEERFMDWYEEAFPVFVQHWNALGLDKENIKISMDYERYVKMEEMNLIHCITARADGEIVGYVINFLITHMHYKDSGTMALVDMYFILPQFRKGGLGVRMFRMMEEKLRARGVVRSHMSCKVHEDHEELFVKLGWKFTDKTFSKLLRAK